MLENNSQIIGENFIASLPFPKKKWFFNLSKNALKARQEQLCEFLMGVISIHPQPLEIGIFVTNRLPCNSKNYFFFSQFFFFSCFS
jgi:hypothetical protein